MTGAPKHPAAKDIGIRSPCGRYRLLAQLMIHRVTDFRLISRETTKICTMVSPGRETAIV